MYTKEQFENKTNKRGKRQRKGVVAERNSEIYRHERQRRTLKTADNNFNPDTAGSDKGEFSGFEILYSGGQTFEME